MIGDFVKKYMYQLVAILCIVINHIYMHYCVLEGTRIGIIWGYRASTFILFDVLLTLLVFGLLTFFRKRRVAYTLTWAVLLIFELTNIIYSRFFHQYLSLYSISEVRNFSGNFLYQYVSSAFRISDILLIFTGIAFFCAVWIPRGGWSGKFNWKINLVAILAIVIPHTIISDVYDIYQKDAPKSVSDYFSVMQGNEFHRRVILEQKLYYCLYGLLRTEVFFAIFYLSSDRDLTEDEKTKIESYLGEKKDSEQPIFAGSFSIPNRYNVVFIVLESFLSSVSDLKVNGEEVTPNLNTLRHFDGVYYNGDMKSSVALGESSDAQLMYFTGLLPLRSEVTVSKLSRKKLFALPSMMHSEKNFNTYMTIPTKNYFWHQDEVNLAYGIDSLYSPFDNSSVLFLGNDDDVFRLAMMKEAEMKEPYMHVILTASTHSPYDKGKDFFNQVPLSFPSDYPQEWCNYLRACWFMDSQLGLYLESLKKRGVYDRTVLVIAADHAAHPELLKMSSDSLNDCKIPFLIANANIDLPECAFDEMEQIDVFSSLMELFGVESGWRGLGQSVFRSRFELTDAEKGHRADISELIINGNWFNDVSE